jgi:hypothetical protein
MGAKGKGNQTTTHSVTTLTFSTQTIRPLATFALGSFWFSDDPMSDLSLERSMTSRIQAVCSVEYEWERPIDSDVTVARFVWRC